MSEPTVRHFRLPDAGEGLTEAEIVEWRVAVGDTVAINDIVVEIETAKAVVELPSPFAGTVVELLVEPGQTVAVGAPILGITAAAPAEQSARAEPGTDAAGDLAAGDLASGDATPSARTVAEEGEADQAMAGDAGARQPMLVGYGPRDAAAVITGRRRRYAPHTSSPAVAPGPGGGRALAKPPIRRLARELGVELSDIAGSGQGGVITRADVLRGSGSTGSEGGTGGTVGGGNGSGGPGPGARVLGSPPVVPQPDDVRVAVRGVRRATAEAMVLSAFTAPHVTEWVQVDVTPTMDFVQRMRADKEFVGLRVSPLLVIAKAVCLAARRNPGVNATWDEARQEVVLRRRVHLGIAAATARGLVVPVIHNADEMHMPQLAQELTDIVATAREGRLQPSQMLGGTLAITNVGVFGVDGGTPILPPGQAAILTMGQIRKMPWVVDDELAVRWVTTLSVSFDHRLVDGELGSAFLTDVAAVLADPARGLIWA